MNSVSEIFNSANCRLLTLSSSSIHHETCEPLEFKKEGGSTWTELRVWYYYALKYNVPGNHIKLCGKVSKKVFHTAALLITDVGKNNFYVPSTNRTVVLPSTHPTACVFLLNSCACMSRVQQLIASMLSNPVNPVKITADPRLPGWTDTKILLQLFTGCLLALQIGSFSKFLSSTKASVYVRIALKCFCLSIW